MDKNTLVLLVNEDTARVDSIRRSLADQIGQFRFQCVDGVPTALARIAGGGVDIVLMRLRPPENSEGDRLEGFLKLRAQAPKIPIVAVCDSADESLAERAMSEGATDYLIREAYEVDLLRILRSTFGKTGLASESGRPEASSEGTGKILAFMGAKGGAGTTTVALNAASVLARGRSVILADFHPAPGTLQHYCQPHRSVRGIGHLLELGHGSIKGPEVEACLWLYKDAPGLHILFGPRNADIPGMTPEDALGILMALTKLADCVVVDLPVSLSETNRTVIKAAALLALVVDRDPISVQVAKLILEAIDAWSVPASSVGAVIVNRAALASPMLMSEIGVGLSIPVLGVIPPAPDLCASAQHARIPIVIFEQDSLAASSLSNLSQEISKYFPGPAGAARLPARNLTPSVSRVGAR